MWFDGDIVATLSDRSEAGVTGTYTEPVLDTYRQNTVLLSCSLPVREGPFDSTAFFDGVLPEGQYRLDLAERAGVGPRDTFGLLARYGRDIAGALVVLDAEKDTPPRTGNVVEMDDEMLTHEISQIGDRPLGVHADSELSIAGLQDKMLLVAVAPGRWGRPRGGAPSTHILKLDHRVHRGVVAAEADAMRLAKEVGLTTATVEIRQVADIDCLIVSRFDREQHPDGSLTRIHQEDACQALGLPPTTKYEIRRGGGGPDFASIARLLDLYASDVPAELDRLASVATFTALIGNADAHGKNLAFLHPEPGRITAGPLYDTVPTVLWPNLRNEAAMTIGAMTNLDAVDRKAIGREAKSQWHHDQDRAVHAAEVTAERLLEAIGNHAIEPASPTAGVVHERATRFLTS